MEAPLEPRWVTRDAEEDEIPMFEEGTDSPDERFSPLGDDEPL